MCLQSPINFKSWWEYQNCVWWCLTDLEESIIVEEISDTSVACVSDARTKTMSGK